MEREPLGLQRSGQGEAPGRMSMAIWQCFHYIEKKDTESVGWGGGVGIGMCGKAAKIALPNISKNMVQKE